MEARQPFIPPNNSADDAPGHESDRGAASSPRNAEHGEADPLNLPDTDNVVAPISRQNNRHPFSPTGNTRTLLSTFTFPPQLPSRKCPNRRALTWRLILIP